MPAIELNIGHPPSPRRRRVPADGDADGAAPFRIVVLGDFSGRPSARREALAERRPVRIDIDNFESVFARFAPSAEIAGLEDEAGLPLRIELEAMDDFAPDAVLARLPAGARAIAPQGASPAAPAASPAPASASAAPASGAAEEDGAAMMKRLLGGSLPAGAPALAAAPTAPTATATQADAVVDRFIRQLVGEPPAAPTHVAPGRPDAAAPLRQVLRDPAWRHLECAWRAVDRFVRALDMADGGVRLELVDGRADELLADLGAAAGDPARSVLMSVLNGDGRGCDIVVSLEEFGPGLVELSLLGGLAAVASAQGAVLLAGAAAALAAVASSEDSPVLASDASRVWRALRESALAPCIGLTFPRLLARLPYGPRTDPVSAFAFDELAGASAAALHDRLVWRSAALDAALLLAQGHSEGGVETRVQLEDLPAFVDRSGDEPRLQAVAEAYLGEREVDLLQTAGLITLQSDRRLPNARVSGWQSIVAGGGSLAGRWR